MSTMDRTLGLLFLLSSSTLVACDSSAELEDCVASDTPGARRDACRESVFVAEDARGREISGVVRRGEDVIPGALVRVEPSAGFAFGTSAPPLSTLTNAVGIFNGLRNVAFRYDLSVRFDPPGAPTQDVLVFRGLGARYVDPSIEGAGTVGRAFSAPVDLTLDRAIPEGRSVAFFATGDGINGVRGDLASGLTILGSAFSRSSTLHVLEYETAGGFAKPTAHGQADILVDAAAPRLVSIKLDPVVRPAEGFPKPSFDVALPAGFTPSAITIGFELARTSRGLLESVPVGSVRELPIIPGAVLYTYRLTATAPDGVVIDTGEVGFDLFDKVTKIELPARAAPAAPLDGETRKVGETFVAVGSGVFEHVLVSQAAGVSLRIIADQSSVTLPDVSTLGLSPLAGPYSWTVRNYPKANFPEELGGLDSRRTKPVSVSKARTITLQ